MYKVIRYENLGQADFGWLKARHHFSFGHYHDPQRMGFGKLRVINDDLIAAGTGFDPHGHRDMEIITFVRRGAITHEDSTGNKGRTAAGNVQVMSAGTGIRHSEYNLEEETTSMFQIWIEPSVRGVSPRWEQAEFANRKAGESLPLLVSGRESERDSAALFIHQKAAVYGGQLEAGQMVTQKLADQGYLLVSSGSIHVDGLVLGTGDALEITGQNEVSLTAETDSEVILVDVPA